MPFVLIGFGAGLRGEEIPLVSLKGLLFFWNETRADPDPFIVVTFLDVLRVKPDTCGIVCPFVIATEVAFRLGSGLTGCYTREEWFRRNLRAGYSRRVNDAQG